MPMPKRISARAVMARGAIVSTLRPKLAADAQLDMTGISKVLADITNKNWLKQKPRLATAVLAAVGKTKFATDVSPDLVHLALDSMDDEEAEDENVTDVSGLDEETEEEKKAREAKEAADKKAKDRKAKDRKARDEEETEEERKKREAAEAAEDEEETEKEKKAEAAMDSKIKSAVREAETRTVARMRSMAEAEKAVLPFVGAADVAAFDSAEDIYKFALEHQGVDIEGVHRSAYRAMVAMLPKPGETRLGNDEQIGRSTGAVDAFHKKYAA